MRRSPRFRCDRRRGVRRRPALSLADSADHRRRRAVRRRPAPDLRRHVSGAARGRSCATRDITRSGRRPLEAAGAARHRPSRAAGVRRSPARSRCSGSGMWRCSSRLSSQLTTVGGLVLVAISAAPLYRAHKALAASRAETRELLQQAPDGIFVADLEGRYTDVNRAGCEMLGYAREEIVGKTILDLIPPEDVGRLAASKQLLLAGKAEVRVAVAAKGRDPAPRRAERQDPAGRPLAGVRARRQRSQAHRGRAPGLRVAARELVGLHRHRGPDRKADLPQSGRASHGRLARRLPGRARTDPTATRPRSGRSRPT